MAFHKWLKSKPKNSEAPFTSSKLSIESCIRKPRLTTFTKKSPDLNPIKNMWPWLDIQIVKTEISSLNDLHLVINETLRNITIEMINNLFSSMPSRIRECLKARGGFIRY